MRHPSHDVTVVGPTTGLPATSSSMPGGSVAKVTSTVRGSKLRLSVVLSPSESVAVSITSR